MLEVVTPRQAKEIILSCVCKSAQTESVGLYDAAGRTAAADIISPESLPAFTRSSVDGLAVRSGDTYGCSESLPAMLEYKGKILMGQKSVPELPAGCCMEIPTGGMLPEGADAAVMEEYTENIGDGFRYVLKPCATLENVILCGDDCKKGGVAVKGGARLGSKNIAVLAALGISEIETVKPPVVGIISTGDEVVDFRLKPSGSQIRDINSVMLYSCVRENGCDARVYPVVPDDEKKLLDAVEAAVGECDLLLISGGTSVGERDAVYRVLSALGEIKLHGIAVKPGKPTVFALLRGTPVFGLPGHPAAAFYAFRLFVRPAVFKMLGSERADAVIEAVTSQNIPSNNGRCEIVSVRLENGVAAPLFAKSGAVAVLSEADGYIIIDRNTEGIPKGGRVKVVLL